jgi:IK cytokine
MLSNKDFANLVKSGKSDSSQNQRGESATNSSTAKERYDLKQVSNWEKQNQQDEKKKEQKGKKSNWDKGDPAAAKNKYRDRVAERNAGKTQPNDISKESEELISQLDEDKTKFLGGDLEHTHLVKGLDYALLAKIKEQTAKELKRLQTGTTTATTNDSEEEDDDEMEAGDEDDLEPKDLSEIQTVTKLGNSIKNILLKTREMENQLFLNNSFLPSQHQQQLEKNNNSNKTSTVSTTLSLLDNLDKTGKAYILDPTKVLQSKQQQSITSGKTGTSESVLLRSVYEFDINPTHVEKDLPLTIVKSKKVRKKIINFCDVSLIKQFFLLSTGFEDH